jgi:hypothetical protein
VWIEAFNGYSPRFALAPAGGALHSPLQNSPRREEAACLGAAPATYRGHLASSSKPGTWRRRSHPGSAADRSPVASRPAAHKMVTLADYEKPMKWAQDGLVLISGQRVDRHASRIQAGHNEMRAPLRVRSQTLRHLCNVTLQWPPPLLHMARAIALAGPMHCPLHAAERCAQRLQLGCPSCRPR